MVSRPLTVVQVLPAMDSGGVERGTLEVANELVRRGHRSIVISAPGRLVPQLVSRGSEHIPWALGAKSPLVLRWVSRLRRLLARERVDILHARSRLPAWIAYRAWRGMDPAARPRLVTTAHGLYSVSRYSRVMTYGEQVIAVSETVRQYLLDNYPQMDPAKIRVIYRGVDERVYPYGYRPDINWMQQWYRQYPQLLDRHVITLAGRLTRLKGHYDFIELITRLRAQGIDVYGLLIGDDDQRRRSYARELRRHVSEKNLDGIIFTGHRDDLRNIMSVSNLVVSLSTQPESFGRTVLEALKLGTPVVGYDHGGVGELLGKLFPEGRTPVGHMGGLVAKTADFIQRPRRVEQSAQFRLGDMLDETIALYQDLRGSVSQ